MLDIFISTLSRQVTQVQFTVIGRQYCYNGRVF